MRIIMTLPPTGALHVLALIATDDIERTKYNDHFTPHTSTDISIHRLCNSPVMHNLSSDIPPGPTDPPLITRPTTSQSQPDESISSASASSSTSTSSSASSRLSDLSHNTRSANRRKARRHGTPRPQDLSAKKKLTEKRREMVDQAKRISSLDNSPANDRQLLVLKMVYDEITMYPSDAWMAIIALTIRRSFKQVKNWFSNERQKRGTGKETVVTASTGDKYRIRPITLSTCKDWSDDWFEEVVMIHHFRILCTSRWQAGRALSESSSIYDGHS